MFTITKRFDFSASHRLLGLPDDHPCARLHGHNYSVIVVLQGPLNGVGFVRDYRDLSAVKDWIDAQWDHRDLNNWFMTHDVEGVNPTAEVIAKVLFDTFTRQFPEMVAVQVSETPKTLAEYRP